MCSNLNVNQLSLGLLPCKCYICSLKLVCCTLHWEEGIVSTIFLEKRKKKCIADHLFCIERLQRFSVRSVQQLACHTW